MGQEIEVLDYEPLETSIARLSEGKIRYEVQPRWGKGCETESEATLYWDKNGRRWLAEVSGRFLEGYEKGEQVFLDFSHDPRTLNQSACKKLLEAYGIDPSKSSLSDIPELEPSRLETMAGITKKKKNPVF